MKLIWIALLTLSLVQCSRMATQSEEQTIAKVNDETVPLSQFVLALNQIKAGHDEISQKNPKVIEQLKTRALNEVLISTILRQEAKKNQIQVTKEEVEGRLANLKDGYPPGGFEEMLRRRNTTEKYLRNRLREQLVIEKMTATLFSSETLVSDEEMKRYYKKNRKEFTRPSKVHAYQIVVPTREEAEKIRKEIDSNKLTFQSAARRYSLSPDAAKGGDLGIFSKSEKIPAFHTAFRLSVNQISHPVQSKFGFHLLKVVEKLPPKKLKFHEARSEIVKKLRGRKEVKIFKEWLANLLRERKIYRNETLFASI